MYYSDMRNKITQYAFGDELGWLRSISKQCTHAVMIGAGPGVMGIALMEGNPDLNLIIVDIQTCDYARAHLEEAGFNSVGYWVEDSATYGKNYVGPKLDFLLIDGDHSKRGVIKDVEAWFRHVRNGGLIFFHDYVNVNDDADNGVAQALEELVKNNVLLAEEIDAPGISMVYKKKVTV